MQSWFGTGIPRGSAWAAAAVRHAAARAAAGSGSCGGSSGSSNGSSGGGGSLRVASLAPAAVVIDEAMLLGTGQRCCTVLLHLCSVPDQRKSAWLEPSKMASASDPNQADTRSSRYAGMGQAVSCIIAGSKMGSWSASQAAAEARPARPPASTQGATHQRARAWQHLTGVPQQQIEASIGHNNREPDQPDQQRIKLNAILTSAASSALWVDSVPISSSHLHEPREAGGGRRDGQRGQEEGGESVRPSEVALALCRQAPAPAGCIACCML